MATSTITITRALTAQASNALTVNFTVAGTAIFGNDYTVSGANTFTTIAGSIVIPANQAQASFVITTVADAVIEDDETIIITIDPTPGVSTGTGNVVYTITNDDIDEILILLHFDGANNSTDITDSSPTPTTGITNTGGTLSTTQSRFGGTSYIPNGSSFSTNGLLIPYNVKLEVFNSDFTQECWLYNFNGPGGVVFSSGQSSPTSNVRKTKWQISGNGNSINAAGNSIITAPPPPDGLWHHYAVVRFQNVITFYVDGFVSGTPAPWSTAFADGGYGLRIGWDGTNNSGAYPNPFGYIDEVRIAKIPVYTGEFTPRTTPFLTTDRYEPCICFWLQFEPKAATSLIVDSTYAPVTGFTTSNAALSTTQRILGGSSLALTTSTSSLTIPDTAKLELSAAGGDYTLEFYYYHVSGTGDILSKGNPGYLYIENTTGDIRCLVNSNPANLLTFGTLTAGVWNHYAITKVGNVFTSWLNGAAVSTTTLSITHVDNTSPWVLGASTLKSNTTPIGFYKALRFFRGGTLYSSTFIPPKPFLTSLLLHFEQASTTSTPDSSPSGHTVTLSTAAVRSVAQFKFGLQSALISGSTTARYLTVGSSPLINFENLDFTIDFWLLAAANSVATTLYFSYRGLTNSLSFQLNTARQLTVGLENGVNIITSSALTITSWNHIALTRTGNTFRLFYNGVLINTATNSSTFTGAASSYLIGDINGISGTAIYIDEYRVVKGVSLFESAFTPRTSVYRDN